MKIVFVPMLLLCLALLTGCGTKVEDNPAVGEIKSYRDIPGITEEEISAIEELKATKRNFLYGQMLGTEAFILPDGRYAGFAVKLCELMTDLYEIPFELELYEWNELMSGLDGMRIDFTGDLTPNPQRMQSYYMTEPILERGYMIFLLIGTDINEKNINGKKIGFLTDSTCRASVGSSYSNLGYEAVDVADFVAAAEMIRTGQIDAFVTENIVEPFFEQYDFIHTKDIFPLAYAPVSLSTANPQLAPIISVMNKYLSAGGVDSIFQMYEEGENQYTANKLSKSFTNEEKIYLSNLSSYGRKVNLALESDIYPISFYNKNSGAFEGIAPEVLERISALTGIVFENVTTKDTSWPDILEMLKSGEISMVSELLYTEARKDDYLWSDEPYVSSNYALLSKIDYPNQKMYQVYRSTIGMVSQYGHGDVYRKRFAETGNIVEFENFDQALDALEKDQIDLLMAAEHTLLKQTSYREKTGYKVNLSFNLAADTRFGFNKNEVLLRSIVSKAQRFVDTDTIVKKWTNQVFNYETSFAAERAIYLSIFLAVLFISMMAGMFFYFKGKGLSSTLDKQNVTLYTIFRSIPDMVFCKDINYAYTSCNAGFEEFAGLSESEIIGKTALELFPDRQEMARGIIAMDKKIIHENFTARVEECFIFPDGREKRLEIIKAPLIQNGVTVGLLGISRDITEHKKAVEEAMEASRAKSMFLAHMSHEIRTPMNAIVGMAELNLREEMSPGLYENTLGIKHAGANLLSIINDILDFSKIEAGKLEIISAEYAFVSLVNDVLSIIRMKITEKPLLFTANVDCNTPGKLIGDEARIRQIILNLLSNAVKYTNEGFVSISVSSIINGDTVELTIKVSDSGTGIKEEDIGKLFGDFTQLNNAVGVQGTGLGLAITRSLCYAMGGTVSVSSEFGVGSTFTVILPQKIGGDGKFAQVENPERKDTLVYESRSVYADSIVNSIENLGVRCTLVSTQEEFSEKLSQRKYPFVFIASFLFEDAAYLINSLSFMSKLVLITEFGEPAPDKNIGTLTMPTHSLSIANILNDVTDKAGYDANGKTSMIFAAPTARVLIVDDVGTNLKVAEGLMTPYRMQIDTCKSGAEALKLAARNRYDIIFMDHMMPVMDGIETTAKIRALEDGDGYYEKVPIIALTANAVTGMRDMFIQKGMNDFLAKPIEIPKLNSLLEKWIPKEKRNKYEEEKQANGVFEIEGVDIKTGISLSGGVENYLSALANFHQNGWGKVNEISKCLEGDDIKRYTEQVLALRNAAARIGAGRVSDFARTMEIAGRSEAWAFIRENTEDLLKELRTLLQNIKIALMNTTNRKPDLGGNDMEFLEGRLSKLKAAIEDMDIKSTDTILNELSGKSWDADICTTIENISTCILMSEYDEATSLTAGLLQEIGG